MLPKRRPARASQIIVRRKSQEVAGVDYLNLAGLRTNNNNVEEGEFSIWVKASQYPKLLNCPYCGCAKEEGFIQNGTRPQIYRDVPRGLKSVYVEVQRQSYLCEQCSKPHIHPLEVVSKNQDAINHRMTTRLVDYIQKLSLFRPDREVALLTGASTKTVREIAVNYREHLKATVRFETPGYSV